MIGALFTEPTHAECPRSLCVFQYAVEMEAKLDQLRTLVEAADRDKVELLNQLEEEKRWVGGTSPVASTRHCCQ